MKYLILPLLLTLTGCSHPEPKFYYGERVNVIGGFYKGCKGIINDAKYDTFKDNIFEENMIIYQLSNNDCNISSNIFIRESHLALAKPTKENK